MVPWSVMTASARRQHRYEHHAGLYRWDSAELSACALPGTSFPGAPPQNSFRSKTSPACGRVASYEWQMPGLSLQSPSSVYGPPRPSSAGRNVRWGYPIPRPSHEELRTRASAPLSRAGSRTRTPKIAKASGESFGDQTLAIGLSTEEDRGNQKLLPPPLLQMSPHQFHPPRQIGPNRCCQIGQPPIPVPPYGGVNRLSAWLHGSKQARDRAGATPIPGSTTVAT